MLVDLKSQALSQPVIDLISHCLEEAEQETLCSIADFYDNKAALCLKGFLIDDVLVGIIGYAFKAPRKILITHLSVDAAYRNQGVATDMLRTLISEERIIWIGAEATPDAVRFYQKLHFECISKIDRDDGRPHYSCQWTEGESLVF